MGVHISFVRSVTMDAWKEEQVRHMAAWGNKKANEYFEGSVPDDYYIPSEHDDVTAVERWIRDKVSPCTVRASPSRRWVSSHRCCLNLLLYACHAV